MNANVNVTTQQYKDFKRTAYGSSSYQSLIGAVGGSTRKLGIAINRLAYELKKTNESKAALFCALKSQINNMDDEQQQQGQQLIQLQKEIKDKVPTEAQLERSISIQHERDEILRKLLPLLKDGDFRCYEELMDKLECQCFICLEEPTQQDIGYTSCCKKPGCVSCATQWLINAQNKCPLCRQKCNMIKPEAENSTVPIVRQLLESYLVNITENNEKNECEGEGEGEGEVKPEGYPRYLSIKVIIGEDEEKRIVYDGLTFNQKFMAQTFKGSKWEKEHKGWSIKMSDIDNFQKHMDKWKIGITRPKENQGIIRPREHGEGDIEEHFLESQTSRKRAKKDE